MSILIVNQSVIDLFASVFTVLSAVVEVSGTRMSRDSVYDQFVCRVWMSGRPLWCMMTTSTYGILLTALDRYVAVVYPVWYNTRVSSLSPCLLDMAYFSHIAYCSQLFLFKVNDLVTPFLRFSDFLVYF